MNNDRKPEDTEMLETYRPGTFGHLLKVATLNDVTIRIVPSWYIALCYIIFLFGLYLAIAFGTWHFALLLFIAAAVLYWVKMRAGLKLLHYLESHPTAWKRYSGIHPEKLKQTNLHETLEAIDARLYRPEMLDATYNHDTAYDSTVPLAGEAAIRQHLESWDSSLFFCGPSRTGKTSAAQQYFTILSPYYYSLKPDFIPANCVGVQGSLDQPELLLDWLKPFHEEFRYRVANRLVDEPELWIAIDEHETSLDLIEARDKQLPKDEPKVAPQIVSMLNEILKVGNAHKVRLALITQSFLSKNTRLDTSSMDGLSWLICGSELGGFKAFQSDRVKLSGTEAEQYWASTIRFLCSQDAIDRSVQGEFRGVMYGYQRLVLGELIRKKWDSKFRIGRINTPMRKAIELEGELWLRVLNLISEIFLLEPRYVHPTLQRFAVR